MVSRSRAPPKLRMPEVFFELASEDRLVLLGSLAQEKQRAKQLAPRISASIQEVSKHLSRLQECGLAERDVEGYFHLTTVGKTVMQLLPAFRFMTEHGEYLLKHDLTLLPAEFVSRVGELSKCNVAAYTGEVFAFYESVVAEAREYIHVMMDHQVRTNGAIVAALSERKVAVRYMVPDSAEVRKDYDDAKPLMGDLLEVRLARNVHVAVLVNESRAGIALADLTGKVDYNAGFWSTDTRFRRWCDDLFEFYWRGAKRIGGSAEATMRGPGSELAPPTEA